MRASPSKLLSLASRYLTLPRAIDARPVGIDFGAKGFRAVKMRETAAGFVPDEFRSIADDFSIDSETGRLRIVRELRKLKTDFGCRFARAAIQESDAYIFTTTVPREVVSDPATAILFKIEENVPIDPRNAQFYYTFLSGASGDSAEVQVAVAVVQKDVVEKYAKVFDEAGITLLGLLTHNQAAARAVVPDSECESLLLVNAHDGITDISVVHGHAVHYSATVTANAEEVMDRVRKVIAFWHGREKTHDSSSLPEYVLLCGSENDVAELKSTLMTGLELSVRLGNVWHNCFSLDSYVPPIARADSFQYASAIGCALSSSRPC
jgi:Tfp pilus assembly PilM family ATPase